MNSFVYAQNKKQALHGSLLGSLLWAIWELQIHHSVLHLGMWVSNIGGKFLDMDTYSVTLRWSYSIQLNTLLHGCIARGTILPFSHLYLFWFPGYPSSKSKVLFQTLFTEPLLPWDPCPVANLGEQQCRAGWCSPWAVELHFVCIVGLSQLQTALLPWVVGERGKRGQRGSYNLCEGEDMLRGSY